MTERDKLLNWIEKLQNLVEAEQDRVEYTRGRAQFHDNTVDSNSDNDVPLANLPYGEELIRTEELPSDLEALAVTLEELVENVDNEVTVTPTIVDQVETTITKVDNKLDEIIELLDVITLPSDETYNPDAERP